MRKLILTTVPVLLTTTIAHADVRVNGYWRDSNSDGFKDTYVSPHFRSRPDGNPFNNWSTKGNINPYTGQMGTKDPFASPIYKSPFSSPRYKGW